MECHKCFNPALVDRAGYYHLHPDPTGAFCAASNTPTPWVQEARERQERIAGGVLPELEPAHPGPTRRRPSPLPRHRRPVA